MFLKKEETLKNLFVIMSIASVIFIPTISLAATFDIWETGMSINEVVSLAREHDIPIAREGVIHGRSKFDAKLIDDNFFKASVPEYRTKIGEYGSKVCLKLTDQPKQVYEIEVRIYGIRNREEFLKEMIGILTHKYGPHRKWRDWVFQYFEWKPDGNSQIVLRMSSGEASVFYIDPGMKEIVEAKEKEKELGRFRKDGEKF
jgi:hypothetical protein